MGKTHRSRPVEGQEKGTGSSGPILSRVLANPEAEVVCPATHDYNSIDIGIKMSEAIVLIRKEQSILPAGSPNLVLVQPLHFLQQDVGFRNDFTGGVGSRRGSTEKEGGN